MAGAASIPLLGKHILLVAASRRRQTTQPPRPRRPLANTHHENLVGAQLKLNRPSHASCGDLEGFVDAVDGQGDAMHADLVRPTMMVVRRWGLG
jgi:hypothetical protein